MRTGQFYNQAMVEQWAWEVLVKYANRRGSTISLPIPVERIAEDVFDLGILWEPIPEPPQETILAGLVPSEQLVVFNETRRSLFEDTPFLYRTVLGHEIGHWLLHVDHIALVHPLFPGFERPFQFVCRRGSDSWEERHAHWFSSHLLLPRSLLAAQVVGQRITSLADMYKLRDTFEVTITVMRIALEGMGCGYVDEHGIVHPSKREFHGQGRLV